MVEIIRNKWCDDLEDLLQCPICMDRPKTWVYQCMQGHHICEDCKMQLSLCPTCSKSWSSVRNRLAENLSSKLDDIKLSLIDPEADINKLLIPDRVSVASQTEVEATPAGPAAKKAVDDHSGSYPCRIGGCHAKMYYDQLVKHIQIDHSTQYIELPMGEENVFQHIWFIDFVEQMTFDRVFLVPGMGTFFLKLSSDMFGNFSGFVLMLHNGYIAKHFTHQLEIACCAEHNTSMIYTGEMCSCRTPLSVLSEKSLQVKRADIQRMLEHQNNLTCTVFLGKKPYTETQEATPKSNNTWKKYPWRGSPTPINFQNGPAMPGPSNRHPITNRQHRPQTAPNEQQVLRGLRDLSLQSRGHFANRSHSQRPSVHE